MRSLPVALGGLALAACLATTAPGRADGTEAQAHEAYDRGTRAYRRGDYATAAREYAAADALWPNPVALQAAIDSAVQADDPVVGMTLVDRARGAPRTDALVTTMLTAERKFAHRVGRIRLECAAAPCLGAIDGAATAPGEAAVVRVGSHTVTLETAGAVVKRVVTVGPGETAVVASETPEPPASSTPAPSRPSSAAPVPAVPGATASTPTAVPAPAPAPATVPIPQPARGGGIGPVWFYVGLGATGVAGGAAIGSAVDTANRHATFQRTCSSAAPSCGQLATDGQSAQTRTNVLLGVTAALAVATGAMAFVVRWHDASIALGATRVWFDARF